MHLCNWAGCCEKTDFQASRFPIDRILYLSLPYVSFLLFSLLTRENVDPRLSLFRLRADCRHSRSAPLLRFTFAMSLPVRSGRGKSVTQERSEAIGCDRTRVCVKEKNRARTSGLHPRSALCELSQRASARPCYETPIIRIK